MAKIKKTCAYCGEEFEIYPSQQFHRTTGTEKRYCSKKCKIESIKKPRTTLRCPVCDKLFVPYLRGQTYCSISCGLRSHNRKPIKICPVCFKEFKAKSTKKVGYTECCSKSCGYSLRKSRMTDEERTEKKKFAGKRWRESENGKKAYADRLNSVEYAANCRGVTAEGTSNNFISLALDLLKLKRELRKWNQ